MLLPGKFQGFDHAAVNRKLIALIKELRTGVAWNDSRLAAETGVSDRTMRKLLSGNTGLKTRIYYDAVLALSIERGLSDVYVRQRIMECEEARVCCVIKREPM